MESRWGNEYGAFPFSNLLQLSPAGNGRPVPHDRLNSLESYMSVRAPANSGGRFSVMGAVMRRTRLAKVSKTNEGSTRRGSRQLSLPGLTYQQFEQYPQNNEPNSGPNGAHLVSDSPSHNIGHLNTSIHVNGGAVLPNDPGSMVSLPAGAQHQFVGDDFPLPSPDKAEPFSSPPQSHGTPLGSFRNSPLRKAADVAFAAYGDSVKIDSALCKKLADEPARREPTQRRHDQRLNIERRSNVEALLAHVTGELAERACKNCHKGHGPWTQCVVYEGQMCGSCTNCWFNASGSRCTFQESNNPQPIAQVPSASTPTQSQAVVSYQQTPSGTTPTAGAPFVGGLLQMGLSEETGRIISGAIHGVKQISKQQRLIVRIEAAAKELGMRIAEYDEYIRSPEGKMDQEETQRERFRHLQRQEGSMDPSSPVRSLP